MTVKELRKFLEGLDDDLIVLEENKGELLILRAQDIHIDRNTVEPQAYQLADGGELEQDQGVVIFGAWS